MQQLVFVCFFGHLEIVKIFCDSIYTSFSSFRTDAIVEGESIGHGLSISEARFGIWVSDVTVLTDLDAADLDDLIEEGNEDCKDLSQGEPLLNYLRFLVIS